MTINTPPFDQTSPKIGHNFHLGQGMLEDDAKAAAWYKKAAEQGDADAQYRLGRMYEFGWGVRRTRPGPPRGLQKKLRNKET